MGFSTSSTVHRIRRGTGFQGSRSGRRRGVRTGRRSGNSPGQHGGQPDRRQKEVRRRRRRDVRAESRRRTALQKDFLRLIETRRRGIRAPGQRHTACPERPRRRRLRRPAVMAIVLKDACSVPMEIMEKCCEAIELIVEFGQRVPNWRSVMQVLAQLSVKQHYRVPA